MAKSKPALRDKYSGPPKLTNAINDKLGKDRVIFVQHCSDLFADEVPTPLIIAVLSRCADYPQNRYLFHTKYPRRMLDLWRDNAVVKPTNVMFGVTLETDVYPTADISNAPPPAERIQALLEHKALLHGRLMISIEPIMAFSNVVGFAEKIRKLNPVFISIGADSKGGKLVEPCKHDLHGFIAFCKEHGIEIKEKKNLGRLLER